MPATSPARTLLAFGAYLACVGLGFLLVPRPLLDLLGLPATDLAWVRLVGLLALYLALYDIAAARGDWRSFIRLSVPLRMSAPGVLLGLVTLAGAPRVLLLFGLVDLAAACWTWSALTRERQA